MKKLLRFMLITIAVIALIWTALTVWVQIPKGDKVLHFGNAYAPKKALIVYNPDPFYNLDEQVCEAFAETLADQGIYATIATVKAAKELNTSTYDVYVFCANTYNWRPDIPTNNFVKSITGLKDKQVVAITLGSGSTTGSKKRFEETINQYCDHLLFSETYWLMRPNDEQRMKEKNVTVAIDQAIELAKKTAKKIAQ